MRFLAVPLVLISGVALASDLTVSALPIGNEVHIRYASKGCYHDSQHEITIRRVSEAEFVATVDSEDPTVNQGATALHLSPKDIVGLDGLLGYYRRDREDSWCTTTIAVNIKWPTAESEEARESFVDRTCGDIDQGSFSTLWELVRRTQCFYPPEATGHPAGPPIVFRGKLLELRDQGPLEWATAKLDDVFTSSDYRRAADARIVEFEVFERIRGVNVERLELRSSRDSEPLKIGSNYLITAREDLSGNLWLDSSDPEHCPALRP